MSCPRAARLNQWTMTNWILYGFVLGPSCFCSVVACFDDLFTLSVMQHQPTPTSVSIPEADTEFQYRHRSWHPTRNFSIGPEGRCGISVLTKPAYLLACAQSPVCSLKSKPPHTEFQYRPRKPIRTFSVLRCPRRRSSQAIPDIGVGMMAQACKRNLQCRDRSAPMMKHSRNLWHLRIHAKKLRSKEGAKPKSRCAIPLAAVWPCGRVCTHQSKCRISFGFLSPTNRRYGHQLRTPFLRTPFPRLLAEDQHALATVVQVTPSRSLGDRVGWYNRPAQNQYMQDKIFGELSFFREYMWDLYSHSRTYRQLFMRNVFWNMYSHLRKYVYSPLPPLSLWIQWLYTHTHPWCQYIKKFYGINLGANTSGACIRTQTNTGTYAWRIIYVLVSCQGVVQPAIVPQSVLERVPTRIYATGCCQAIFPFKIGGLGVPEWGVCPTVSSPTVSRLFVFWCLDIFWKKSTMVDIRMQTQIQSRNAYSHFLSAT